METNKDKKILLLKNNSLIGTNFLQKLMAFASLIIMFLIFSIAKTESFLNFDNIVGILLSTAVNGILALGVTFVIISGGIDLSVGTVMTLSAVMAGVFIVNLKLPIFIGIPGALLTGAACGLVSGTLISKMKVPPFIATLGIFSVAKGLALVISGLKPIYFVDYPDFQQVAMGTKIFGIPNAVLIFFGAAIIAHFILSKTILGRYTYALGSNEEAARLSGIKVNRWKMSIYALCGMFSGLAAVIMASRINAGHPALGAGYEFEAITAAVIGGTSLSGGVGTILGTVIGAFVMSVLTNGLRILSIPQEWQTVIIGTILILAVYIDMLRRGKQST